MSAHTYDFVVFYNTVDQDHAGRLVVALRERDVRLWCAESDIHLGRSFVEQIEDAIGKARCAAILIGSSGLGTWQKREIEACLAAHLAIVPVLLPGSADADVPLFLATFPRVDMRLGVDDPKALDALQRGTTRALASATVRTLVAVQARATVLRQPAILDNWAAASIKFRLHTAADLIAMEAANQARLLSDLPRNALTMLVPLAYELRWKRGYLAALVSLLQVRPVEKSLGDFACEAVSPPCPLTDGVLTAEDREDGVLVRVGGTPAATIKDASAGERDAIVCRINQYGRLGAPRHGAVSLLRRLREVPAGVMASDSSAEAAAQLSSNRECLAALVARFGLPGLDWLLPPARDYPAIGVTVFGEHADAPRETEPDEGAPREEILFRAERPLPPSWVVPAEQAQPAQDQ